MLLWTYEDKSMSHEERRKNPPITARRHHGEAQVSIQPVRGTLSRSVGRVLVPP